MLMYFLNYLLLFKHENVFFMWDNILKYQVVLESFLVRPKQKK